MQNCKICSRKQIRCSNKLEMLIIHYLAFITHNCVVCFTLDDKLNMEEPQRLCLEKSKEKSLIRLYLTVQNIELAWYYVGVNLGDNLKIVGSFSKERIHVF